MIRPKDRFERNPDILHRRIKGDFILLPIHPKKETSRQFYFLDGIGDHVWELLDGRRNCGHIVAEIASEFKVKKERIEEEVRFFLNGLVKEGLIRRLS